MWSFAFLLGDFVVLTNDQLPKLVIVPARIDVTNKCKQTDIVRASIVI